MYTSDYSICQSKNVKRVLQSESGVILLKYFEIYYFHATTGSFKMHGEIEKGLMMKNKMDQRFKMTLQNKYLKSFVFFDMVRAILTNKLQIARRVLQGGSNSSI